MEKLYYVKVKDKKKERHRVLFFFFARAKECRRKVLLKEIYILVTVTVVY